MKHGLAEPGPRRIAWMFAVAGVYFVSAKLGLDLAFATPNVTAVWPPTGIALAALVLGGRGLWPGVALGALAANATTDVALYTAAGIAVGNTLEAVAGAWLLERAGFNPQLTRLRDVFALTLLAAVLSTTISATIGVASLSLGDSLSGETLNVWRVWWLGDMTGDLLIASLILVLVTHWPYRDVPGRALEALVLAGGLVGVGLVVFTHEAPTAYLAFPLVAWAAIRFLQPGATIAPLLLATIAVAFTANDAGPFVQPSQDDSLLVAQGFSAITALTALILAAVTTERRLAERRMRGIAHDLQAALLPPSLPQVPEFDVAGWYRAGARGQEVGGDFYDLFEVEPGQWMAVIGDVCGKGAEAASLTALARHTLRAVGRQAGAPSDALRILNGAILEQRTDQRFLTATLARVTASDLDHSLTLSTGGHHPSFVVRADGEVEEIGPSGTLLGVYPDPELADHRLELLPDDALVLFTDGLSERRRPVQDRGALIRQLLGGSGASADELVSRLQALALGDGERADDDVAVLVLRRRTPGGPEHRPAEADVREEISLPPDDDAPAAARRALDPLRDELDPETYADLRLLVSELVTNSVRHGGLRPEDRIRVRVALGGGLLRLEVSDAGVGFDRPMPRPQPHSDLVGGWGLYLTDRIADRWGVERVGRETWVWLEKRIRAGGASGRGPAG